MWLKAEWITGFRMDISLGASLSEFSRGWFD
jgi:hypothetical protein